MEEHFVGPNISLFFYFILNPGGLPYTVEGVSSDGETGRPEEKSQKHLHSSNSLDAPESWYRATFESNKQQQQQQQSSSVSQASKPNMHV